MKTRRILLGVVLFLFACSFATAHAVTLSFSTDTTDLMVGDIFDVDLMISGDELKLDYGSGGNDLSTFDLIANYDSSLLNFESYALGSELGTVGTDAYDLSGGDLGSGQINLSEISWLGVIGFGGLGFQADSFALATLSFKATGIGNAYISISLSDFLYLGDFNGDSLLLKDPESLSLNITRNTSPVPEPTTFLLLGAGLLGLSARMRLRGKKIEPV